MDRNLEIEMILVGMEERQAERGRAALRATRSHATPEARPGLRPSGFDQAQGGSRG